MIKHKTKEVWRLNFVNLMMYLFAALGIAFITTFNFWLGLIATTLALLATTHEIDKRDYWLYKNKIVEHKIT